MRLIIGAFLAVFAISLVGCSAPAQGDPNPPAVAVTPAPVSKVGTQPAAPKAEPEKLPTIPTNNPTDPKVEKSGP